MPFIHTMTTKNVSKETEAAIVKEFGKAITLLPGKSEQWLMLRLEDNCRMAFRGSIKDDVVMVDVSLLGSSDSNAYDSLTKEICRIISSNIGVSSDKIYVKYFETDHWGYDGFNF